MFEQWQEFNSGSWMNEIDVRDHLSSVSTHCL